MLCRARLFRLWLLAAIAMLSLFSATHPAVAVLTGATSQAADEEPAGPIIDDTSEVGSDARIASRIEHIFEEVPGLSEVSVSVREGVVKLDGSAPDKKRLDQAEEIASRVDGVVTVVNDIERDVSVDESVGSLGKISQKAGEFVAMLPLILVALAIGAIVAAIGYLLASLTGIWHRLAPNSFLAELFADAIKFVFVVAGIVIALDMIGAGALMGAVLGGAGVIGLALGFAMRDTVENYVASIMLSLRQPFRANDHVLIDDLEGRVIRLTSRATILMTLDGNHLRIPNSTVFKAVILNYTRNPQRRFDFELGIDADDDPRTASQLGVTTLQGLDFVLDDPPPQARIAQVGDSNIVITFLAWIDQREADWYKARSLAIPAVKDALEEAGFALPEPIYRLRFDADTPLPMTQLEVDEAPPEQPRRPEPATTVDEVGDVRPDDEVAEMVESERRAKKASEKDLLDDSRPVE